MAGSGTSCGNPSGNGKSHPTSVRRPPNPLRETDVLSLASRPAGAVEQTARGWPQGLLGPAFGLTGTFVILANRPRRAKLRAVIKGDDSVVAARLMETRRQRLFYGFFLPLGVVVNFALGLFILSGLQPASWPGWLEVGTGALCCLIAGWLAAAAWSKSYWHRTMARQVATWRRIADAFFAWLEEAPVPAEALHSLRSSLEEAVPGSERR